MELNRFSARVCDLSSADGHPISAKQSHEADQDCESRVGNDVATDNRIELVVALSISAGFCEEFVFRGYLIWAFSPYSGYGARLHFRS